MYSGAQPRDASTPPVVVVGQHPAAVLVDVEQPLGGMALEQDEPTLGREQPDHDGRPGIQVLDPGQRAASRVDEIGAAVERVRRREHVRLDPAGRGAGRVRETSREREHPRAEVDPDDLVGTQVPEREGVPPAGALEVDRPAAPAVEIADELDFDAEQVDPPAPDQSHGLLEPALVPLGRLLPGSPVRGVHPVHAGQLGRGGRADVGLVRHAAERSAHVSGSPCP
jgi:hypothetical protein